MPCLGFVRIEAEDQLFTESASPSIPRPNHVHLQDLHHHHLYLSLPARTSKTCMTITSASCCPSTGTSMSSPAVHRRHRGTLGPRPRPSTCTLLGLALGSSVMKSAGCGRNGKRVGLLEWYFKHTGTGGASICKW
eukprot:1161956-Pelagomonas_calceolata.AAC.23